MAFQRGVSDRAGVRRRHGLAIVVVVAGESRESGQQNQDQHTGQQMHPRPAHNADARAPPEPGGEFAARLDPPARADDDENGRQQCHRGQEGHRDPDRRGHPDGGEHPHLGEADREERDSDGGGRGGDHLAHRGQCLPDRVGGAFPAAHIVVVAADQEYRVIRSRTGDHRAQQDDGLVGHTEAGELGETGNRRLGDHQGDPDPGQRQQHGDRVAVHHQQYDEHQHGDRDLDRPAVPFAGDGQVGHRGRRSSQVYVQRTSRGCPFDDAGDPVEGRIGLRGAQCAGQTHRKDPGLVVLARQERTQRGGRDEFLHHHDVALVATQCLHQLPIGGFGRPAQPALVGQDHQQEIVRARFLKRLGHLPGRDVGRRTAGQHGQRMLLCHLVQARQRQRQRDRHRNPDHDDRQRPPHDDVG